ncbi:MAG TPA: phenylalanine--tRNA ligase beta subunit-related protein [Candidatus Polarisedimenticolia bacterium]|nr:phenylalanine--tRNA ligase beta subunit-related protein [Candidatus Polarisedimenticolia bacterium]
MSAGRSGLNEAEDVWEPGTGLRMDDEARRLLRAGLIHAAPVAVGPAGEPLLAEMERIAAALASEHAGRAPGEIADLAPARELYRDFGIDPTRTRPSSEALLRRVLQGKGLPRILNAVDVCTLCSLRFLLPIGLYDAGCVRGEVTLRRGRPGESYPGIRKDEVHLEGRPTLADAEGPFGNPTSDSFRTSVTPATRALAMVIFAPSSCARDRLAAHVAEAQALLARHLAPAGEAVTTSGSVLPAP